MVISFSAARRKNSEARTRAWPWVRYSEVARLMESISFLSSSGIASRTAWSSLEELRAMKRFRPERGNWPESLAA